MVSRRSLLGTSAAVGAASVVGATTSHAATPPKRHGKRTEANKKVVRAYVQSVFNEHRPDLVSQFVTDDVVWHGGILGEVTGAANLTGLLRSAIGAIPDLYAAEQDVVAENDLVVVRLLITGTHTGDLLGVPATGNPVSWDAVDIYRIRDGRISEEWAADDNAALMAQIGAFNPPWLG